MFFFLLYILNEKGVVETNEGKGSEDGEKLGKKKKMSKETQRKEKEII